MRSKIKKWKNNTDNLNSKGSSSLGQGQVRVRKVRVGLGPARHPQGLGRIIRRQEFASEFGYFLKSNTSPRSWFGTLKVLEKFKFAISRFINLLQSSNFGLFAFLKGSIRSAMEK